MVLTNPFFWAFLGMFGAVAGNAIQGSPVVGTNPVFGFCRGRHGYVQPCDPGSAVRRAAEVRRRHRSAALGGAIIALALALMAPLLWRSNR